MHWPENIVHCATLLLGIFSKNIKNIVALLRNETFHKLSKNPLKLFIHFKSNF